MGDTATMYQWIYDIVFHATSLVLAFLRRDSWLYWPFMVSTVVIGYLAWRYTRRYEGGAAGAWSEFRRRYLGRALWWHPSARADYRYYFLNGVLFPLLVVPFLLSEQSVAQHLDAWLAPLTGAPVAAGAEASIAAKVVFTLVFFVAYDGGRFLAHTLLHDVEALWYFHKVHHSAEVLTPFTTFRVHPVDLAVMIAVPAVTTGVTTWLFHRYVDAGVTVYTFLGVHVILWVSNLVGNLRHWQVWLSYGPTFNRWLISPAHHQLHHSAAQEHWGCNRGFELAIWDRLYGTLVVPPAQPLPLVFGLGDGSEARWHHVGGMYALPFTELGRRLVRPLSGKRATP